MHHANPFGRTVETHRIVDIIGELCHFLEIVRIVTALSRKPVILAVPIQARQTAQDQ
jgi:hypothetical protein